MCLRSARSAGCALKSRSTWPTGGSASSALRTGSPITLYSVVAMCIATGLVGGEAFSIDASLIKADVDKKKGRRGDQRIAWPKAEEAAHAVREYLAALDTARDEDGGAD